MDTEHQQGRGQKSVLKNIVIGIALCAVIAIIIFYVSAKPTIAPQQPTNAASAEDQDLDDDQLPEDAAATDENEVVIDIMREGSGDAARSGSKVSVHYVGTLADGTVFDSSRERNQPYVFVLGSGSVIAGWDIGVAGMKVGEVRKLTIPPELAYGEQGIGPIPGNATLTFEVELLKIE